MVSAGFGGRHIVHWKIWFYGQPRSAWERLWFRPGFRHCIAFTWLDTDRWLELDPRLPRLGMRVLTGPQYARRMRALSRLGGHSVEADVLGGQRRVPRVATCAGVLAHVIGSRPVMLPHALYREMVRL